MTTNEKKTADWYEENMKCLFAAAVACLGCTPIFLVAYMMGQASGASTFQILGAVLAITSGVCGLISFVAALWMGICCLLKRLLKP